MENEILAFIENLDGFNKKEIAEFKRQKIEVGNVVLVTEIIPTEDSYSVEIGRIDESDKHFVLNANNVALYKSYGDSGL